MCVYIYAYVDAITIDVKRSYEFEGKWGREQGRVWREERDERNVIIKFNLKNKQTTGKDDTAHHLMLVTARSTKLPWYTIEKLLFLIWTPSPAEPNNIW